MSLRAILNVKCLKIIVNFASLFSQCCCNLYVINQLSRNHLKIPTKMPSRLNLTQSEKLIIIANICIIISLNLPRVIKLPHLSVFFIFLTCTSYALHSDSRVAVIFVLVVVAKNAHLINNVEDYNY